MAVLNIPILRWGQPYTSLETDDVKHFLTGETLAKVGQANTGLLSRDMRLAPRARQVLTEIPVAELIGLMKKAADLYLERFTATRRRRTNTGRFRTPAVGQYRACRSICPRPT
jgi:hypothetical protein